MLYDQAQLATVYTEAFQITHDPFYVSIVRDILDLTLREMRDPVGGFYSALDVDSPIERGSRRSGEGAFYAWAISEIEHVLGPDAAPIFEFQCGITREGNVHLRRTSKAGRKVRTSSMKNTLWQRLPGSLESSLMKSRRPWRKPGGSYSLAARTDRVHPSILRSSRLGME